MLPLNQRPRRTRFIYSNDVAIFANPGTVQMLTESVQMHGNKALHYTLLFIGVEQDTDITFLH